MSMPRGLQKPHHYAEIVFPILALIVVAWASIAAWTHVIQTTAL